MGIYPLLSPSFASLRLMTSPAFLALHQSIRSCWWRSRSLISVVKVDGDRNSHKVPLVRSRDKPVHGSWPSNFQVVYCIELIIKWWYMNYRYMLNVLGRSDPILLKGCFALPCVCWCMKRVMRDHLQAQDWQSTLLSRERSDWYSIDDWRGYQFGCIW